MKITITLNAKEIAGIKSYLSEIDGDRKPSEITLCEVLKEIEMRLYHSLRDPREAISDHILEAEKS